VVQIPYSGFALAARALLMHSIVRVIRTVGFLSVVMPHPKHTNCYAGKFPPVPEKMGDYILAGIMSLKGGGGCNDLIIRFDPAIQKLCTMPRRNRLPAIICAPSKNACVDNNILVAAVGMLVHG
jgi:hypothetical protein